MSKLVIICTVCLLTIVSKSNSLSNSDIKEILDVLRSNRGDSTSSDSSDDDSDDSDDRRGIKYLRTVDVLELIRKFNNKNQNNRVQNNNEYRLSYPEKRKERYESGVLNDLLVNNNNKKKTPLLGGLKRHVFHQLIKDDPRKGQKKSLQLLGPNRLLTPVTLKDEDERGQMGGLHEYSKIFVVLDPLAVQRNENKNDLKSLVSKVLSASSSTNEKSRHEKNKGQIYKGFRLKDNFLSRRYRRESRESYAPNSMSDDVIKRRPKYDYGGGGGGSMGGRTAIPYVKLRGDIYERDHK